MTQRTLESNRRKSAQQIEDEVLEMEAEDESADDEAIAAPASAQTAKKGRVTPGRRNQEAEEDKGNALVRGARSVRDYFEEVRDELSKVTWPSREEVTNLTRIVLIALVVSSITMGLISLIMGETIRIGLANPLLLVAIIGAAVGVTVWSQRRSSSSK